MAPVDTITKFDLIVIGSGPAGQRAAIQAVKAGKSVAIVEDRKLGGACAHLGTIPSKSLREAALKPKANWAKAIKEAKRISGREARIVKEQFHRNKVAHFIGKASFLDSHRLLLQKSNTILEGKKFLVATGARPLHLAEFPFQWANIHDSDSILSRKKAPKSLLILGAGVIGCEYASLFTRLGTKVTLVDRRKELLRNVDDEMIAMLRKELGRLGVRFLLGEAIGNFEPAKGSAKLKIKLGKKQESFEAALICMGRAPNSESLDLSKAGVLTDARGFILVNENYQTNIPHIYAAGDVIGAPALAATSSEQGRMAARHAFGLENAKFPALFPCGIYTDPEIAFAGQGERELLEKKIPFVVGRAHYSELARGQILGDENGLLKLFIHRETKELLGTHIIGQGATELVHIGMLLQRLGAKLDFIRESVFNYPTLAEAYKVAAYNALNQIETNS